MTGLIIIGLLKMFQLLNLFRTKEKNPREKIMKLMWLYHVWIFPETIFFPFDNIEKTGLYRYIYNSSFYLASIDVNNSLDFHRYLMKNLEKLVR